MEGAEVPFEAVARGYEAPDDRMVVLTDEDLADLPVPAAKSIEVWASPPATPSTRWPWTAPATSEPPANLRPLPARDRKVRMLPRPAARTPSRPV
ncbi:hypothetical protein AR457_35925 [Streptomyces agglomeratus]|uniref:Uncharacterized protein n=2 Tax=Streptomyces agglomeratus TaxID=285458 RepID=A0A1E5NYJ0_9ACTN|nr:hypothetical protein [Streptomyces agglomeratus]OEJ21251.1 hypothetical protein AS594_37115 [Streptomyces agglomeratus]OEJ22689.1 hypothetical protein AR457_35925 [Streptomyces agglomeratus]OEJ36638.1 hypothetical protein BGK72_36305 [Streptomyces agglomeratus]OEJ56357.1 hypothetical protein BGM19_37190 [Streptomyces agglomeratus]